MHVLAKAGKLAGIPIKDTGIQVEVYPTAGDSPFPRATTYTHNVCGSRMYPRSFHRVGKVVLCSQNDFNASGKYLTGLFQCH